MMQPLNLPSCKLRIRENQKDYHVYDNIRKKFVRLTPEEWVRQHFVSFLIYQLNIPASHIAIELSLKINRLNKRCDIVVFDSTGKAFIIIECKQPQVLLDQTVLDQAARYNLSLNVPYIIITNGLSHISCKVNHETQSYHFLEDFPVYI